MLEHFIPTNSEASAFKFEETQFMTLRDLFCFTQGHQCLEYYWQLSQRLVSFSENSTRMVIGFQASESQHLENAVVKGSSSKCSLMHFSYSNLYLCLLVMLPTLDKFKANLQLGFSRFLEVFGKECFDQPTALKGWSSNFLSVTRSYKWEQQLKYFQFVVLFLSPS